MSMPASKPNVKTTTKIMARDPSYRSERKLIVTIAEFCNAKRTIAAAIKSARAMKNCMHAFYQSLGYFLTITVRLIFPVAADHLTLQRLRRAPCKASPN